MVSKGVIVRKLAGVVALVVAASVAGTFHNASAGQATDVTGVVTCDTELGEQVVTWTLRNRTSNYIDVMTADLDATALTAGSSLDTVVHMTPLVDIQSSADSVGSSSASGDATGVLVLNLNIFQANIDDFMDYSGNVTLPGGCAAVSDTVAETTSPATLATSAPVTSAPVTTLTGAAGGALPTSGNSGALPIVAALMIVAGAGMVLLRRRSVTN